SLRSCVTLPARVCAEALIWFCRFVVVVVNWGWTVPVLYVLTAFTTAVDAAVCSCEILDAAAAPVCPIATYNAACTWAMVVFDVRDALSTALDISVPSCVVAVEAASPVDASDCWRLKAAVLATCPVEMTALEMVAAVLAAFERAVFVFVASVFVAELTDCTWER